MAQEHTIAFGPFRLETPPGRFGARRPCRDTRPPALGHIPRQLAVVQRTGLELCRARVARLLAELEAVSDSQGACVPAYAPVILR